MPRHVFGLRTGREWVEYCQGWGLDQSARSENASKQRVSQRVSEPRKSEGSKRMEMETIERLQGKGAASEAPPTPRQGAPSKEPTILQKLDPSPSIFLKKQRVFREFLGFSWVL